MIWNLQLYTASTFGLYQMAPRLGLVLIVHVRLRRWVQNPAWHWKFASRLLDQRHDIDITISRKLRHFKSFFWFLENRPRCENCAYHSAIWYGSLAERCVNAGRWWKHWKIKWCNTAALRCKLCSRDTSWSIHLVKAHTVARFTVNSWRLHWPLLVKLTLLQWKLELVGSSNPPHVPSIKGHEGDMRHFWQFYPGNQGGQQENRLWLWSLWSKATYM